MKIGPIDPDPDSDNSDFDPDSDDDFDKIIGLHGLPVAYIPTAFLMESYEGK